MLIITVHVNAPPGRAIGIKEQIAQDLERYGDTRVVSVEVVQPSFRQMKIGEIDGLRGAKKQERKDKG